MDTREYLKSRFKTLTTFFYAMLFGMLMIFGVASLLLASKGTAFLDETQHGQVIELWLPIVIIALIPLSYMVYSNNTKKYRQEASLETKVDAFFKASIVRFAMLEAAGALTSVAFMLTYSRQNTYLFVAIVVIFLMGMPGAGRFINDMNVRGEEKKEVERILRNEE